MLTLQLALKRAFDVVFALVFGCLSLPILCCAVVIVQWYYPGRPVFLRQTRVGKNGIPFTLLKLRTLRTDYDPVLHHDEPLPPIIIFLRRVSLDELPQLLHVLSGVMSVVGIRPLLVEEHAIRYGADALRVTKMRPALISLHSVKTHLEAASDLPVAPRDYVHEPSAVELALDYVEGWSLRKDWVAILAYLRLAQKYLSDGTLSFKSLRQS